MAAELDRRGLAWAPLEGRLEAVGRGALGEPALAIHCAAAATRKGEAAQASNVVGMERLLDGLASGVRVVFTSSKAVYGVGDTGPLEETAAPGALTAYGASKRTAEALLRASGRAHLILRLPSLIGVGRSHAGHAFPTHAAERLLAGERLRLADDRLLDDLEVRTAARALLDAGLRLGDDERATFNLAGPVRSLHGQVRALAAVVASRGRPVQAPEVLRGHPVRPVLDSGRFAARFGPVTPPPDGAVFEALVDWLSGR